MDDLKIVTGNAGENEMKGPRMNVFQRIAGIILSPAETMKNIVEKPGVIFPILAYGLGMLALYLIRFPLYQELLKHQMELGLAKSNTQLTPEQLNSAMKIAAISGLVATPITSLAMWIIITAIVFGIIKLFKGQGSFKQVASVIGYAYVITLAYILLCLIVSFFTGKLLLDTSLANITNLVLPDLKGSFVYGIIRGIDLFVIWQYVVMAIGIVTLSKLSKSKVYSVVGLIYIASIIIAANSNRFM